ncbi:AMP-binding protein [Actinocorallia sp. API 0066]|uniref:AMP-binding protein n=1 Tax=Actinocorallia sp. API 0066 TaxID=2896846 RepID=UPI001E636E2C|nr:AMP-binding protein [Actinocorallia sp. API 0066]MCD0453406.1 AMP-binding protein [Actinocorallia sp. API 0066]
MSADLAGLTDALAAHPDRTVRHVGRDGRLTTRTFAELRADVEALVAELSGCGVRPGDLVGIAGPNCHAWVVADLALLALGCVSVAPPLSAAPDAAELAGLAERYHMTALLLAGDAVPPEPPPHVAALADRPLRLVPREAPPAETPEGVFTVAFSSGTSGTRKGLLLTRAGVANTIDVSATAWRLTGADDLLVVMPFSNFQQRYLMYLAITTGCSATIVVPERMFQKMRTLEPTVVLGPPSFYEIVAHRVDAARGRERLPYLLATALHTLLPDRLSRGLRALLGARWTGMYGSRVRLMFTGSAPVPSRVVRMFQRLGAPLYEVYGSTEVGWIAFNLPGAHRTGTAGRPVPGVAVELGDDGEVVVHSTAPQAAGYVFDGVETAASVFRADGALTTGDLGVFAGRGFLRLVGRSKNVIITRSGVKINPEELELDVERRCPVTRALVASPTGDGLLTCVVWLPDPAAPDRVAEVETAVAAANAARDTAHRITEVVFRPDKELTVENGLLTRNLKLDRAAALREVFPEAVR